MENVSKENLMSEVSDHYDRAKEIKEFDETKAGVKGLVDSGITKIPRFFIHSLENQPKVEELHGDGGPVQIPVIDLDGVGDNPERRKIIVEVVRRASETWGFFQMVNHGIPVSVLDEMIEGVRRFHEQPSEVKKELYSNDLFRKAAFASYGVPTEFRPAHWKDILSCNFHEDYLDFEEVPLVCRDIMIEYLNNMVKLKDTVSELLSEALGLNPGYLRGMECMKSLSINGIYYPQCPEPELTLGSLEHTDPLFLTILLQDHVGGLQVRYQQKWIDVPPLHGALIANVGDLVQLITNDKFKSVEHRVLPPGNEPRISVATFAAPADAKPYGPIQELLSDNNPAVYRETLANDYLAVFSYKGLNGTSSLPHFKL